MACVPDWIEKVEITEQTMCDARAIRGHTDEKPASAAPSGPQRVLEREGKGTVTAAGGISPRRSGLVHRDPRGMAADSGMKPAGSAFSDTNEVPRRVRRDDMGVKG